MPESLAALLDRIESSVDEDPLAWAQPANEDVLAFWESTAKVRVLSGGNRAAKTESEALDYLWFMKGEHPHQTVRAAPVAGRIEVTDHLQEMRTILPKFQKYLPPSMLWKGSWSESWRPREHRFLFANGSITDFVTHETPVANLQGSAYDVVWMDEEPPRSHYIENIMRTMDTDGRIVLTFSAIKGITWSLEEIVERAALEPDLIFYRELDVRKNRFLDQNAVGRTIRLLTDPKDREVRIEGKVNLKEGLVFHAFSERKHLFHVPHDDWDWEDGRAPATSLPWVAIDPGWEHPTGILFGRFDPNQGRLWVLGECKAKHTVPKEHVAMIFETLPRLGMDVEETTFLMDSQAAASDASGTTIRSSYTAAGLPHPIMGTKRLLEGNTFLELLFQEDRLFLHESCQQLVSEIRHYRAYAGEGKTVFPTKRDDLIAALRYAAWHFRPYLLYDDTLEPSIRALTRHTAPRTGY